MEIADSEGGAVALELIGEFVDDWGTVYDVTAESVTIRVESDSSVYHVLRYDNESEYLVAENDADNLYYPGEFSRIDWSDADGTTYLCHISYDAIDAEAAEAITSADRTRLSTDGCNGFEWSSLSPQ